MNIKAVKLDIVMPPQDDLLSKIRKSKLSLKEGDIVAVSSKVVSIWEGRVLPIKDWGKKDEIAKREAEKYHISFLGGRKTFFTIKHSVLIRSCGIDSSNGDGYFILWPKNPKGSAEKLLAWFKKEYKVKKIGLIITDSHSIPLRRGALGFALARAGFEPIYDYRGKKDIFNNELKSSQANIADALASSAVLSMGEGAEQTPLAVIRDAPHINFGNVSKKKRPFSSFEVPFDEDVFSVFLKAVKWKKGENP
ncbi:MAG: coenzyme F420-0:L-glutamate ligase [bacterium]|nr:coenzyme F420-0:L-glutamate ligase [bacterium]